MYVSSILVSIMQRALYQYSNVKFSIKGAALRMVRLLGQGDRASGSDKLQPAIAGLRTPICIALALGALRLLLVYPEELEVFLVTIVRDGIRLESWLSSSSPTLHVPADVFLTLAMILSSSVTLGNCLQAQLAYSMSCVVGSSLYKGLLSHFVPRGEHVRVLGTTLACPC